MVFLRAMAGLRCLGGQQLISQSQAVCVWGGAFTAPRSQLNVVQETDLCPSLPPQLSVELELGTSVLVLSERRGSDRSKASLVDVSVALCLCALVVRSG